LSGEDIHRIHRAALGILETIGVADPTPEVEELACAKGCSVNQHGRLSFPRALVEDLLAGAAREYVLYSRGPAHADLHIGGNRVYYGTSGEAVSIFDVAERGYRPSTLVDLYDCCRLVDGLENIHQFGQTVVPTDLEDIDAHDLNVAYVAVAGTQKPCEMAVNSAANIRPAIELFDMVLGGEGRFRERPFLSFGGCPIVSPLRFARDSLDVLVATSRLGLDSDIAVAPQAGATAPAYLAGTLVQVVAEGLACLAVVNMVNPGCPMSFANWPFVSDLRTGAFTGGSGEEAVLMAAAAQIGRYYDLPTSVAASMTDSKIPDAQAGYEKGITAVLAGLAGANRVVESVGMLGSLMGCSFEVLVIDNDMLGMAQRAIRGIEVTDETLSVEAIGNVALGAGHYLGHADTLRCMESEFLYPDLADRTSPDTWAQAGSQDILERSRIKAREILASHYPDHIGTKLDKEIRGRFPIMLPRTAMRPRAAK
jgi:trimethylamine--corrinoid protein Co-methyltransferase